MGVTFADLMTPAGVVIAAGVITALVELIKTAFPVVDAKISGASMAFIISAVLYVIAAVALTNLGNIPDLNGYLSVFLAWLAAATSSVGIKASFVHYKSTSS